MRPESLSDALGYLRDETVERAIGTDPTGGRRKKIGVTLLTVLLAAGALYALWRFLPAPAAAPDPPAVPLGEPGSYEEPTGSFTGYAQLRAAYPAAVFNAENPDAWENAYAQAYGIADPPFPSVQPGAFCVNAIRAFCREETDGNRAFSPTALYFSVCGLHALSGGKAKSQLESALHAPAGDAVYGNARRLWLELWTDRPAYTARKRLFPDARRIRTGLSLWLPPGVSLTKDGEIREILRDRLFTSVYKGDPEKDAFQEAWRDWLSVFDARPAQALAASGATAMGTVQLEDYFFNTENDVPLTAPFYGDETKEIRCFSGTDGGNLLHSAMYFRRARYEAYGKPLFNGAVWFLLPAEDATVPEMIDAGAVETALRHEGNLFFTDTDTDTWSGWEVAYTLPCFSVEADTELRPLLTALGIKELFEPDSAQTPGLSGRKYAAVKSVRQCFSLRLDENGLNARHPSAAVDRDPDAGTKKEPVRFVCDRPFVLLVVSGGQPVVAAVIRDPGSGVRTPAG